MPRFIAPRSEETFATFLSTSTTGAVRDACRRMWNRDASRRGKKIGARRTRVKKRYSVYREEGEVWRKKRIGALDPFPRKSIPSRTSVDLLSFPRYRGESSLSFRRKLLNFYRGVYIYIRREKEREIGWSGMGNLCCDNLTRDSRPVSPRACGRVSTRGF